MIKFNTAVYYDVQVLFNSRNTLDLKEAVREAMMQDDAPSSLIYDELAKKNPEYLEAFSEALNLIDYITVDDTNVSLERFLTENAEGNSICLCVPCFFDDEKFVHDVIKKNECDYEEQAAYEAERNSRFSIDISEKSVSVESTERAPVFKLPEEMLDYLIHGNDLYCPALDGGTYVSLYSSDGAIKVSSNISVTEAKKIAHTVRATHSRKWNEIYTKGEVYPAEKTYNKAMALDFCVGNFDMPGWIKADTETFCQENLKYIIHNEDIVPCEWIIGVSGSEMDDVRTELVHGTTKDVKRYLMSLVETDKNGDNTWVRGTESIEEIKVMIDGKLYAKADYRDCHMDYTATPESAIMRKDLTKYSKENAA